LAYFISKHHKSVEYWVATSFAPARFQRLLPWRHSILRGT
jgi:hypothetical protein